MAKIGDLLTQIQKKKSLASIAAAEHKHTTPDQLVANEIAKKVNESKPTVSQSFNVKLGANKGSVEGQLGVALGVDPQLTPNQPLIKENKNQPLLGANKGSIRGQLGVALGVDPQLTPNQKPLIDPQLTPNQPLTIIKKQQGQLGANKGSVEGQLRVANFLKSEIPLWIELGAAQSSVILFLYQQCDFTTLSTKSVKKNEVSKICGIAESSVSSTFKKLIKLGLIARLNGKRGEDGYSRFQFEKTIYSKLKSDGADKEVIKRGLIGGQLGVALGVNKGSISSSMYVGNINNNTIHTEPTHAQSAPTEPDPWSELRDVDFSQLHQLGLKVTIVDTFKKNKWVIDRFQLEDFIERFHRYMTDPQYEERRSKIKNPYSLFLGSIKDIANGEPHSLCDVKTEYELQKEVALKNQSKQVEEFERLVQDQQHRLNQLLDSKFNSWLETLTADEQITLVPPQAMAKPGSVSYKQLLKAYFTENIWSKSEHSFLNSPRA